MAGSIGLCVLVWLHKWLQATPSNPLNSRELPSDFWGRRAGDYRFPAFKVPYAIAAGETVRIEVSEDDIEWATLHGGGFNSDGHYFLGEGFGAVEYQACEATDTLFNGGIIASRPGCLHLRVIHDGEEHDVRIGLALTCA